MRTGRFARTPGWTACLLVLLPVVAWAGAQKYTHPEFAERSREHRRAAVLPFRVSIDKKHLPKNTTLEMIENAQEEEGMEFQRQLYARFLQRAQAGEYRIEFQDVDETNALLNRGGMKPESLMIYTRDEIAHALGVDALVSGTVHQTQPTSKGMAVAQTLLIGFSGSTERVDINMTVHDAKDGALLWSYDHTDKGGLSNTVEAMTKSLLKKVAGNFPYRVEKNK